MFKLITDNRGVQILVNINNIEAIYEFQDSDTQITLVSGEKFWVTESLEILMPLLGVKTN